MFDDALEQIVEYASTTARANGVEAIGELVRNIAAAGNDKVFAKLFPIAKQRIMAELKAGASSTRTTTTSISLPSDAALHWWQSILNGIVVPGRTNVSQ
jgi:proteasome activator subunit 4